MRSNALHVATRFELFPGYTSISPVALRESELFMRIPQPFPNVITISLCPAFHGLAPRLDLAVTQSNSYLTSPPCIVNCACACTFRQIQLSNG